MKFFALAGRNFKEIYRDPLTILLGLLMPVGLLFLFTSLGKRAPQEMFEVANLVPAVSVFGFAFLTMFSGMLLAKDRQSAFLTRLLSTPLSPVDFIGAYTLPLLPVAAAQIAVCHLAGFFLGLAPTPQLLGSVSILMLTSIACVSTGLILGSLLTENQVAGAGSLFIVTVSLFSGAWMDLKMVGGIFQTFGYLLPFAHAIDACRDIMRQAPFAEIRNSLFWVGGYTILLFGAGVAGFTWKTRR